MIACDMKLWLLFFIYYYAFVYQTCRSSFMIIHVSKMRNSIIVLKLIFMQCILCSFWLKKKTSAIGGEDERGNESDDFYATNLDKTCRDEVTMARNIINKYLIWTLFRPFLKGEFTDFLKSNTTLGHIYTLHFTIKTPSDRFRMAVMAQNVVLFCTLLGLHKEKTLTTNIK